VSLLFHNPEMMNLNVNQGGAILAMINALPCKPSDPNYTNVPFLATLASVIANDWPATTSGGWATLVQVTDANGKPVVDSAGNPVYRYDLDSDVAQTVTSVAAQIKPYIFNDLQFQDTNWHPTEGITVCQPVATGAATAAAFAVTAAQPPGTHVHGVKFVKVNVIDAVNRTVQLQFRNDYLRYLSTYVQFANAGGDLPITPSGRDTKRAIFLDSNYTVLGIPLLGGDVPLSSVQFNVPTDASIANLMQGNDNALNDVTGITLSQRTGVAGYSYLAGGQGVPFCGQTASGIMHMLQNVFLGEDPDSALKQLPCGFQQTAGSFYEKLGSPTGPRNFFLQPAESGFLLQSVALDSTPFNVATPLTWGIFSAALDSLAVVPTGYVVGVDRQNHKMQILELLTAPSDPSTAPQAVPFSVSKMGPGTRVGLLMAPGAVTVFDAAILILEAGNQRIQAVDVSGNPVLRFQNGTTNIIQLEQGSSITYLDLGVEGLGYLYVLSYVNDGSVAADYRLDVYDPQGNFLTRTTSVTAARMAVDTFRNVYTLQASGNCVACNFNDASLLNQRFHGLDLSQSTFSSADVEDSSFAGANLSSTSSTAALLRNDQFTGATMLQAELGSDVAVPTSIFSCDFRGADLTGAYFDQSDISNATFGDTDPSQAANLSNTSWQTLDDPGFITQLQLVDFRNVNLAGARFLGTQMSGVDFSGASLDGADLTGGSGTCTQVEPSQPVVTTCDVDCIVGTEPSSGRTTDFSNAVLASSEGPSVQFQTMKLADVTLTGAHLAGGVFDGYDLSGSELTGADLTGTHLSGANLQSVTLTGAMLGSVQLNGANLDAVDLHGLTMVGAQLNGASLYEANLQGTNLDNAQLIGARLGFSNLEDASLRGVVAGVQPGSSAQVTQLGGAYMVNVDLTDADLRSTDLSGAHLYGNSLLVRTLLDSADLGGAVCAGTTFSGSFTDTVFQPNGPGQRHLQRRQPDRRKVRHRLSSGHQFLDSEQRVQRHAAQRRRVNHVGHVDLH